MDRSMANAKIGMMVTRRGSEHVGGDRSVATLGVRVIQVSEAFLLEGPLRWMR